MNGSGLGEYNKAVMCPRDYLGRIGLLPAAVILVLPTAAIAAERDSSVFDRDIQPILASRCMPCHSDKVKTSGLALTNREAALAGGSRGPAIVPGKPEESLIVQALRRSHDLQMPPGGPLDPEQVELFAEWVRQDALWATTTEAAGDETGHWSFRPVRKPDPPAVRQSAWVRNGIDRFVLARLESEGITPSAEADRRTLIRRLSLDITGFPPSPKETAAFVEDVRPGAYQRLVDRLLASPHYGERWGRHWLDAARYADSDGYNIDGPRLIWMYRDWVINALNADMPFDQFAIEQIAGDMLPNATREQIVATGFHRNTLLNLEGGIDFEQYRVEAVVDRLNTTGAVFLGLTVGCARCHDHKFDPITQREFYRLFSFFNNVDELSGAYKSEAGRRRAYEPILEFASPEEIAGRDANRHQVDLLEKDLDDYRTATEQRHKEWRAGLAEPERTKIPTHILEIFARPRPDRNYVDQMVVNTYLSDWDSGYAARLKGLAAVKEAAPKIKSTLVMRELPSPREAYIHINGDFLRKGDTVQPGTPAVLPPLPSSESITRLDLARWLVDETNPLTPRVTVNRIWQRYFGIGIVETENDFGTQGTLPSHPELLDWLASEFVGKGWSLKQVHRLIVTSATYRQASDHRAELGTRDPRNRLLARQSRVRLEAEIIRDSGLAVSGLLARELGGPSVFPPQPEGVGQQTQVDRQWQADKGANRYRRGMYTHFWRAAPHPGLVLFDAPDSTMTCTRRNRSNTPLQALTLLNDEGFGEMARALAARVLREADTLPERVRRVYQLTLAREPDGDETEYLQGFVADMVEDFGSNARDAAEFSRSDETLDDDVALLAAWTAAGRVLMNLDEFITRE